MSKPQVRQITKTEMKVFGESFRMMREYAGIEMRQMAELLKVSTHTYSRWESGKVVPQIDINELDWQIRCIVKSHILGNEYLFKKYKIIHSLCSKY